MTETMTPTAISTLHVRFDGRSEELPLAALDLGPHATDAELKRALEAHLDRPPGYLETYAVVRHSDAIVVRPEAIYG